MKKKWNFWLDDTLGIVIISIAAITILPVVGFVVPVGMFINMAKRDVPFPDDYKGIFKKKK